MVTHGGGKELEEPLVIRPTSETIIYSMFAKWIQSYRDLPLLINQWCNVVRWEMRTRLFLRTTEFLWQEGHTAHATEDEAEDETRLILAIYRTFAEEWMAMPVLTGRKTDSEKFAGALRTYACEALMQDNKALQAGTSHNLGQNFAKAFDVKFQTDEGGLDYVWNTSWGVSTRLIGGADHDPRRRQRAGHAAAPGPVAGRDRADLQDRRGARRPCSKRPIGCCSELKAGGDPGPPRCPRRLKPGAKYYEWEARGVPLRLEVGPRDVAGGRVMLARRTGGKKEPFPTERPARLDAYRDGRDAAGAARRRADPAGAEQHSRRTKAQFLDFLERRRRIRLRRVLRQTRSARPTSRKQTKATIRVPAGRGVPLPGGAGHLHLVRPAEHRGGGMGQGVLKGARRRRGREAADTAALFEDAGLDPGGR